MKLSAVLRHVRPRVARRVGQPVSHRAQPPRRPDLPRLADGAGAAGRPLRDGADIQDTAAGRRCRRRRPGCQEEGGGREPDQPGGGGRHAGPPDPPARHPPVGERDDLAELHPVAARGRTGDRLRHQHRTPQDHPLGGEHRLQQDAQPMIALRLVLSFSILFNSVRGLLFDLEMGDPFGMLREYFDPLHLAWGGRAEKTITNI